MPFFGQLNWQFQLLAPLNQVILSLFNVSKTSVLPLFSVEKIHPFVGRLNWLFQSLAPFQSAFSLTFHNEMVYSVPVKYKKNIWFYRNISPPLAGAGRCLKHCRNVKISNLKIQNCTCRGPSFIKKLIKNIFFLFAGGGLVQNSVDMLKCPIWKQKNVKISKKKTKKISFAGAGRCSPQPPSLALTAPNSAWADFSLNCSWPLIPDPDPSVQPPDHHHHHPDPEFLILIMITWSSSPSPPSSSASSSPSSLLWCSGRVLDQSSSSPSSPSPASSTPSSPSPLTSSSSAWSWCSGRVLLQQVAPEEFSSHQEGAPHTLSPPLYDHDDHHDHDSKKSWWWWWKHF